MSLDPQILEAALVGLEMKKATIDDQIASIRAMLGGRSPRRTAVVAESAGPTEAPAKRKYTRRAAKKRNLSPEARERIAAAQKKRWEAHRKANG